MPKRLTFVGILTIIAVTLVVYFPVFRIGFDLDDWGIMELLMRLGPGEFIWRSFNPVAPDFLNTYRPLQGLFLGLEFFAFGPNAWSLHFIQILLHLINSLLISLIGWQITKNQRAVLLAGLVFASLPVFSQAVFLISATDVFATFFSLLAVWAWILYLVHGNRRHYVLAIFTWVLGLFCKESVVTLPITLLLVDRLLLRIPTHTAALIRRYSPVVGILLLYVSLEVYLQPRTTNYSAYGLSIGPHLLTNAVQYLTRLFFPWNPDFTYALQWFIVVTLILVGVAVRRQSLLLAFLGVEAILNILPVIGFQFKSSPRFLYAAGIVPSVLITMLVESAWRTGKQRKYSSVLASLAVIVIFALNATGVSTAAQTDLDQARFYRTPFRDISQHHASFPDNTLVYIINSPTGVRTLAGMFSLKYEGKVSVSTPDSGQQANWRRYQNSLIYYLDATGRGIEVPIDRNAATTITPQLPVNFGSAIRLEGYEISSNLLRSNQPLVLLLYWKTTEKIEEDYTLFVHLVNSNGEVVDGYDSQPRMGQLPTSKWQPNTLIVDTVVMPVSEGLVEGQEYHLELGLYYLPTMQRLPVHGEQRGLFADQIVIEPFKN